MIKVITHADVVAGTCRAFRHSVDSVCVYVSTLKNHHQTRQVDMTRASHPFYLWSQGH